MITYVIKTFMGVVLFDQDLNHIPTEDGDELPAFYVSIDERHLFTFEEIEEQQLTEAMGESYINSLKGAIASKMARNGAELLIGVEKHRMQLKYYPKLKKVFVKINKAVVDTIKNGKEE